MLKVVKRDYNLKILDIEYSVFVVFSDKEPIKGISFILDRECKENDFQLPSVEKIELSLIKDLSNNNNIERYLHRKEFCYSDNDNMMIYSSLLELEREFNIDKIFNE
jgi:hypothetical protein